MHVAGQVNSIAATVDTAIAAVADGADAPALRRVAALGAGGTQRGNFERDWGADCCTMSLNDLRATSCGAVGGQSSATVSILHSGWFGQLPSYGSCQTYQPRLSYSLAGRKPRAICHPLSTACVAKGCFNPCCNLALRTSTA